MPVSLTGRTAWADANYDFANLPAADGDRLVQLLQQMPYTSMGTGLPVYVQMSQTCSACQVFWQDLNQYKLEVEFRLIPMPLSEDNQNQVAQIYTTRNIGDFNLYMNSTLPAEDLQNASDTTISVFNNALRTVEAAGQIEGNDSIPNARPRFRKWT